MPRPTGSARPRLVLGVVLLLVGVGDLLFMNIVLLPQVLAVEVVPLSQPTVSAVPVAESPVRAGPEPGQAAAQALAVAPALTPPAPPAEEPTPIPSSATLAPTPAEQPSPAQAKPAQAAARIAQPSGERPVPPAPTPERAAPSFAPMLFTRSTAWLSPKADDTLSKLAAVMKADPSLRVRLDGHTDDFGSESFNDMLSLRRARRARARLEGLGIAQARIDIKGHGSDQPAETERNAKSRARNRRVEITLY